MYVIVNGEVSDADSITKEIRDVVNKEIGPIAKPDKIQLVTGLPKTRSGKIMRRVLRKIAANDPNVGDISTMADSSVVQILQDGHKELIAGKK